MTAASEVVKIGRPTRGYEMEETLAAIKRVIAKRRARGASDQHIVQYKMDMLQKYKHPEMQNQIKSM